MDATLSRSIIQRQNAQDSSVNRISSDAFSPTLNTSQLFNSGIEYFSKMSSNLPFFVNEELQQQEINKFLIVSRKKIGSGESGDHEIFGSSKYFNRQQNLEIANNSPPMNSFSSATGFKFY